MSAEVYTRYILDKMGRARTHLGISTVLFQFSSIWTSTSDETDDVSQVHENTSTDKHSLRNKQGQTFKMKLEVTKRETKATRNKENPEKCQKHQSLTQNPNNCGKVQLN